MDGRRQLWRCFRNGRRPAGGNSSRFFCRPKGSGTTITELFVRVLRQQKVKWPTDNRDPNEIEAPLQPNRTVHDPYGGVRWELLNAASSFQGDDRLTPGLPNSTARCIPLAPSIASARGARARPVRV